MIQALGEGSGVLGGGDEEVLDAPGRVVGERIYARDVLLGTGDAHRWLAFGQGASAAHRRDHEVGIPGHERGG